MTKSELESKHLSDLHLLAADAGIERYRMLTRAELIERLADGAGNGDGGGRSRGSSAGAEEDRERPARRRRRRGGRGDGGSDEDPGEREAEGETPRQRRERPQRGGERNRNRDRERERESEPKSKPERESEPDRPPAPTPAEAAAAAESGEARPRRRRRRRFGRRGKQEVTLPGLLLPPEAGRQALLYAETRESCTQLLRGVAADVSSDPKGPDPIALLIDPTPEELADWRRDAPQAEIVAAGQPRHASDALAQAAARASKGEDVFLLVDSLTRLGEAYEDAEAAKEFFDAGRSQGGAGGGSLTVIAAVEKPAG